MKFTIVIHTAPWSHQGSQTALRFCEAALKAGHSIYRLFFYYDAVHNSSTLAVPAQDEFDIPTAWQTLINEHDIDAVSCVSSALKRGILNEQEAKRYEKPAHNLMAQVELSGLGQLVEATSASDRVVSFGA